MPEIAIRPVTDADADALFRMMKDPESVRMAAFTAEDPSDRARFDAHLARVRTDPEVTHRAITSDGTLVGSIAAFVMEGDTEVTYWIDRPFWGQGIASEALALLLMLDRLIDLALERVESRACPKRLGIVAIETYGLLH